MKTVLFDIFPAVSHFNCTLKLAGLLREYGYHVIYMGLAEYKDMVDKHGFDYYIFNPYIIKPIPHLKSESKGWFFLENLITFLNSSRVNEALESFEKLNALIEKISPDIVMIDIHKVILRAPFYQIKKIPLISIHTTFDVKWMPNVPPITSYFIPYESKLSFYFTGLLFLMEKLKNRFKYQFLQIRYLWQDELSIARKYYKLKFGIQLNKRIDFNRSFGYSIKNLPRLILAPTPLDFKVSKRKDTYNVGPLLEITRENDYADPRYNYLLETIKGHEKNGYSFIVYCSMGTLAGLRRKKTAAFFKRMLKTANLNPGYLFILSTGKSFNIEDLYPTPKNLCVFESVPQVHLLKQCDVMITHGGASSLAECVINEVPVIVFPFMKQTDIPSNSARVVFHKIGLRGNIKRDSAKKIGKKINHIKSNYEFYKNNVREMKKKFEEKNNSTEVISVIESIIENHENHKKQ
jgi:UDP:flavonoid glycosyltransferase YjiC (YdhE family)